MTATEIRIPTADLARFECHTHRGIHTVERLREAGVPARRQAEMLDQMAAVCILETYLGNS